MKSDPVLPPEDAKAPAKVGIRIAAIVGGFVLAVIIVGWIYIASHR
jgi:hypothetical protein